jgi:hypothetical protein
MTKQTVPQIVTDPTGTPHRVVLLVRRSWTFQYAWNGWEFYLTTAGESVAFARAARS